MNKGYLFERRVGSVYLALGAKVERNAAVAGNQIDLLVSETTPSGRIVRTAVECKAYTSAVGLHTVNSFAAVVYLLRHRQLIEKAAVVATNGFTAMARTAANEHQIELIDFAELQARLPALGPQPEIEPETEPPPEPGRTRIFVVMPFSREFLDVYVLGIRAVAEQLGLVVERADDVEHSGDILELIRDKIRGCDLVIGDTTALNPNVMYEVGFAHGIGKPAVLVSRSGQELPFDLASTNHILYDSIVELRDRLERRLRALLDIPPG